MPLIFCLTLKAVTNTSAVASDLADVPQAWYSLDGSHVVVFQKDGEAWYAQISESDGTEVLWGTEADRPLCGCVSNDGKSIAVLTGTPDNAGSTYDQLRVSVITQDEDQFTHDLPGTTIVESSGPQRDAVLAIAKLDFEQGQPVVTFVSDGRVLSRIRPGQKGSGDAAAIPASRFSADSTRTVIAKTTEFTWRLASVSPRPEISNNHVVAPISTGILAACILKAREPKDRKDAWKRLMAKLQVDVDQDYSVDDWIFGMKAAGCFGWGVPKDVVAPGISGFSVRQGKFLMKESPSAFWTRMILVSAASNVVSGTQLNLASAEESTPSTIDEFTQLPVVEVRRSKSHRNEIGLISTLTFSAEWAYPFNAANNLPGKFHSTLAADKNSPTIPANLMKGNQEFCRVAQSDGWRMARLPLLDGYSVLFLLSDGPERFREMDDAVFAGRLPSILSKASWNEMKLDCRIPIFALSRKLKLLDGLSCLNEGNGPFASGLNSGSPLALNEASQSVLLQIDEDGVSAAPSTTVDFSSISPGESLTVERPFHVCVLADGSDFPIIIARVISPEVIE